MTLKYLLFGQYLHKKGLITSDDIFNARMLQKRHNPKLGAIAIKKSWLTEEEVQRILVSQEETDEHFGSLAVKMNCLTLAQVNELLGEEYLYFGEALVKLGVISKEALHKNLEEFKALKAVKSGISEI